MAALWNRAGHYIFIPWFLLSFFFFFSSPNLSCCRLDVYHTSAQGVALVRIYNTGLKCAARGWMKIGDAKIAKHSLFGHHRTILSGCIFATKACIDNRKTFLNSSISSIHSHNMVNFGPLVAEIGLPVWGTPANFNGFLVLPSLLQRRRSPEANHTLQYVWPSPGLVHYRYIFGAVDPWRNFTRCKTHFASKSCVLLHWQRYCTALQQRASAKLCDVVQGMELRNFCRGRNLYLAGRPSCWASAHILVFIRSLILEMSKRSSAQYMWMFVALHTHHISTEHWRQAWRRTRTHKVRFMIPIILHLHVLRLLDAGNGPRLIDSLTD